MTMGTGAYLAIDIGASKTLLAAFSTDGQLQKEHHFATTKDYKKFLSELNIHLEDIFSDFRFLACCCAIPGIVDRRRGVGLEFGNLNWKNVPIARDLSKILDNLTVYVENDANLAGLSEALLVHKRYKKVLYLTISTGIGDGIIIDGKIDPDFADSESGQMLLERSGLVAKWEDFASGQALKKHYGMLAKDIEDPAIWKKFATNVALGLNELLAVFQPDVVIIGGSVGAYFEKWQRALIAKLKSHPNKMVDIPPIIKAQRPKEAVIYGCYQFIRQSP